LRFCAIASFLAFLARRRSWVFLRPSQVCSRKRVSRRFRRSGPTCRFARRASDPIDFRRADRSPARWVKDFLFTRRSTSGLRSRLRSASCSSTCKSRATGSILPRALPLAGLWARVCAFESGSTPIESSASGIPRPTFHCEPHVPIRSWVFTLAPMTNRRTRRPFSVLMGLMPCRPERLRGPSRANSLSEVLHRP